MSRQGRELSSEEISRRARRDAERRHSRRKRRPRLRYGRVALALVLVVLLVVGVIWFVNKVKSHGAGENTLTLKYGELDVTGTFDALVIRNEKVVSALSSGRTNYLKNEGDLVDKGDVILEIEVDGDDSVVNKDDEEEQLAITKKALENEIKELRQGILVDIEKMRIEDAARKKREYLAKKELLGKIGKTNVQELEATEVYTSGNVVSVYSSLRGMLSYTIDGLEAAASLGNIYTFDFSKMDVLQSRKSTVKTKVARGEQMYKIIDDSLVYIAIKIPPDQTAETYTEAESFVVNIAGKEIEGRLHESFLQGDSTICVILLKESFPSFNTSRILPCTVTVKGYKGLIVPSTAFVYKDGVIGVYRVGVTGLAEFVPVNILKNDAGSAIIQNDRFYNADNELVQTVQIGQIIVREADKYKEGMIVE